MVESIWVFCGSSAPFPSGVFTSIDLAEQWIAKYKLTGTLTRYPINIGIYDWAIQNNFFKPKDDKHKTAKFIQQFSSASQEHYHYEDGIKP